MVARGEETRSWADFVYQEMHVVQQTAWKYRRLWRLILDFPGLMFSLECMKSLLGWHNAVRAYMNGNPSISVIFQTPIAWMEIPQPYPSWNMKGSHSASSKPSFKTYHTHVLGSWQARFEAMRLARRRDHNFLFFVHKAILLEIEAFFANLADSRLVMATDGSTPVPQDESEPATVEQPHCKEHHVFIG